jgi:hypothetical protein
VYPSKTLDGAVTTAGTRVLRKPRPGLAGVLEAQDARHGCPEALRAVSRKGPGRVEWGAAAFPRLRANQDHRRVCRLPTDRAKQLVDRCGTDIDVEQDQVVRTAREEDLGLLKREDLQQPHAVAGVPVHCLADQERGDCVRLDE